jgi:hypothetical protein
MTRSRVEGMMNDDIEAIAAAYYRQREEKLQKMVDDLILEAASQGVDADELLLLVAESWDPEKDH